MFARGQILFHVMQPNPQPRTLSLTMFKEPFLYYEMCDPHFLQGGQEGGVHGSSLGPVNPHNKL